MIEVIVALTILLSNKGYTQPDINCAIHLVKAESDFRVHIRNPKSNAYGLFQILNITKNLTIKDQVERFDRYIKSRYEGNICKAYIHQKKHKWY